MATESVVIAAGPFSGIVAALAGVELPVQTVRRQKLVLPEVPEVPAGAPMTVDDDTGAHWRPAFRGASLLFTDPTTPPTPPEENVPTDQAFAFQLLDPSSPQSVSRVAPFWRDVWTRGGHHWMLQAGQYTMTPDRRPLLGQTAVEGLFVNAGYSGRGVMGSPAGGRILIDVLTGKLPLEENQFRPDRAFEDRPRLDPPDELAYPTRRSPGPSRQLTRHRDHRRRRLRLPQHTPAGRLAAARAGRSRHH